MKVFCVPQVLLPVMSATLTPLVFLTLLPIMLHHAHHALHRILVRQ